MASLTHVCMWHGNSWKSITAEEAATLHPGGTVSAYSGLFMCELCGQYVILTGGYKRKRYFKHSAYEKSKDCPERTFGAGYSIPYDSQYHELPIRIKDISTSSFRFEIGLIRAPIISLSKDFRIEIKPKGVNDISYVFSKERLNYDSITYLSVGEVPFENYTINFRNGSNKLHEFWPAENNGIDPEGTLFEKDSGKKILYDADIEIKKEYYLLKRGSRTVMTCQGMSKKKILQKQIGWQTWTLYVVSASEFNEDIAKFFLDFHCRLTDYPISLQPVWPLYVEGNYLVKHSQDRMYMLVTGNVAALKTFPSVSVRKYNYDNKKDKTPIIYDVDCSDRQQLISVGRSKALKYTYFWKETLDKDGLVPEVLVTDLDGIQVASGEMNSLPRNKTLRVKSVFDGEIVVSINNRIIDKRKIKADKIIDFDGLAFGLCIKVVIGLDVIWQIDIKKQAAIVVDDECEILQKINNASDKTIKAPHSLKNILVGLQRYPQVCQWIRLCIKNGVINEQSYRRLQEIYRTTKSK